MGNRSVFKRSPLGARRLSPLGAFVGKVTRYLEIFTVPPVVDDGLSYVVTGELFGETQGYGMLLIGDNPLFDSSTVMIEQQIDSWSSTQIQFTASISSNGLPTDGPLWIKVVSDDGQEDQAITQAGFLIGHIFPGANRINGITSGLNNYYDVEDCPGAQSPIYCGPVFSFASLNNTNLGGYGEFYDFIANTPGFSIYGANSEKIVILGTASFYAGVIYYWLNPSEGLAAGTSPGANPTVILPYNFAGCDGVCAGDPGGWDAPNIPNDGEDVYLLPAYPLSIQITFPADGSHILINNSQFSGYSFAAEGDISSKIAWTSDIDGPIGTGASIAPSLTAGAHVITATCTNAGGQQRFAEIDVTVEALAITSVDPTGGDEAGGTSVTITGTGFAESTTVEFGGIEADNIIYVSIHEITCDSPAPDTGTTTVDVAVIDGADSDTLTDGFTYGVAPALTITSISPDNGPVAGGTAVTVTGTGFDGSTDVIFLLGMTDLAFLVNITVVNDTTITGDTDAPLSGTTGTYDVGVSNAQGSDVLVNGFTFT